MAKQGRAGTALGVAALGSFFAGTVTTIFVAAMGEPLTNWRSSSALPNIFR